MLDPPAFKAVSYGLILLLAFAGLLLSLVSLRKEIFSDKPVYGLVPFILVIAGLCGLISVLTTFLDAQRPVSVLLKWERAAVAYKE
jgi:uncharacterized membrane protein